MKKLFSRKSRLFQVITKIKPDYPSVSRIFQPNHRHNSQLLLVNSILNNPDGMCFFSLDSKFRYTAFSVSYKNLIKKYWGIDIEVGNSVFDLEKYVNNPDKFRGDFNRVLSGDNNTIIDDYFDDGCLKISLENKFLPLINAKKVVTGVSVIVSDITERKKAERALHLSSEHQSLILRSLSLVFYTASIGSDLRTTWISDQVETITGYPPSNFTENSEFWSLQLHPEDRDQAIKEYNCIFENGLVEIEYRWKCSDGSYRWFFDQISLSYNDNGIPSSIVGVWVDITSRKIAEENLKKSELDYRRLFDKANDVIIIFEPENEIILEANIAACNTYGFEHDDLVGMSLKKLTKNILAGEKQIKDLITNGIYHDFETIQYNNKGEEIFFLINSTTIEYNGKPAILSLNRNITEKKRTENALKEIEQSYTGLFNTVTEAIYIQNENGVFIDVNIGVENMYGHSRNEIIGKTPDFLSAPGKNDMFYIADLIKTTFSTGEPQNFEFWGIRKNGEIFPKDVVTNKGKFCGKDVIITTARDISERRKAEQALRQSEARLKLAIESGKQGIWEWNTLTGEFNVNAHFYEMFGFVSTDIEPSFNAFKNLIHPDDVDPLFEIIREHIKGKTQSFEAEHRFTTKGGEWKWVRAHGKVIESNNLGDPLKMIGTVIDVDILKSLTIKQQQLNESKDKLMSIIAHDLRSPFNSILGFSHLLMDNIRKYEIKKIEKFISQINSTAKQTLTLLDNLITWYKTQTGMISFNPLPLNLNQIINEIVELCYSSAKIKNLSVQTFLEQDISIFADEDMLKTVLRNLVSNAIKFTKPNGKIEINSVIQSNSIIIEVSDNGIGINQTSLETLFNNTINSSSNGTEMENGSGLGLLICKEFMDKHQGKIWVESQVGQGSKFYIKFPKND